MDLRTRALSVLRLLYDLQDGWALLGLAIVLGSNLSRVFRWIGELNAVETTGLIIGATLIVFWFLLRAASVIARLISAPIVIERPSSAALHLALHGQAGVPVEQYRIGVGGLALAYRRWQPIELMRLTLLPQMRFY